MNRHWVTAGQGPPVYLLHGFPETWYGWRKQIPVLAERFTVIAPDLRGYGDTEKPASGYDKRTIAEANSGNSSGTWAGADCGPGPLPCQGNAAPPVPPDNVGTHRPQPGRGQTNTPLGSP
ncbi:alpha/beta fold hydrolase [Embleya scabrispora]|uniref:alpha/beta fold hydrolase n=1 Tax=Embleya scabrispora TaxID=159449 RepID=UPI000475D371